MKSQGFRVRHWHGGPRNKLQYEYPYDEHADDIDDWAWLRQELETQGYIGARTLGEIKAPFLRDYGDPYIYNKVDEFYDDIDDFYRDYMQGKFARQAAAHCLP